MADVQQDVNGRSLVHQAEVEADRLGVLIRALGGECERLRQALANAEHDRDLYKKAVYAQLRGTFDEFREVDISGLTSVSAGPVECLEYLRYHCVPENWPEQP